VEPFEKEFRTQGFRAIAGLDEAGRGPLAGPVVAAAVILPGNENMPGIDDSKKLSITQREKGFELLQGKAVAIGIGVVEVPEIDRLNILQASLQAMVIAAQNLSPSPDLLLIDGNHLLALPLAQRSIIKGDQRCLSIAAASIVAKVTRDRLMLAYHQKYPEYNFAKNKGYGTKEHFEAILTYGCCPLHRQSFKTIYQPTLL
jgi:ribonuclease HII